jgi:hypothetical protein
MHTLEVERKQGTIWWGRQLSAPARNKLKIPHIETKIQTSSAADIWREQLVGYKASLRSQGKWAQM